MKMCYPFLKDEHFSTNLIDTKVFFLKNTNLIQILCWLLSFSIYWIPIFTLPPRNARLTGPAVGNVVRTWDSESPAPVTMGQSAIPSVSESSLDSGKILCHGSQGLKEGFHKSTSQTEMQTLILLLQMINVKENWRREQEGKLMPMT